MDSAAQESEYYVWQVPGKPVSVHLHLEVVDRMASEVMRGFGAVPKRGAEVGGILIGAVEPGEPSIVRIEDFEPIPCDYKRGPSYLFSGDDEAAFNQARERWGRDISPGAYAVGYFRSHTRDGMTLSPEDIELMDRSFAEPTDVALLIKPFATKVSQAGFFFREDGDFPAATPSEFPFRRRELEGDAPPPRRSLMERKPRSRARGTAEPSLYEETPPAGEYVPVGPLSQPGQAYAGPVRARRAGWTWMPLSFIFLILGVVLGFQAALTMGPKANASGANDYSISLSVTKSGDNLNVKWDRDAPAMKAAKRGIIEIHDGAQTISRDLDAAELRSGNMIYRNSSSLVLVRLSLFPSSRFSVTETVDWKP